MAGSRVSQRVISKKSRESAATVDTACQTGSSGAGQQWYLAIARAASPASHNSSRLALPSANLSATFTA